MNCHVQLCLELCGIYVVYSMFYMYNKNHEYVFSIIIIVVVVAALCIYKLQENIVNSHYGKFPHCKE